MNSNALTVSSDLRGESFSTTGNVTVTSALTSQEVDVTTFNTNGLLATDSVFGVPGASSASASIEFGDITSTNTVTGTATIPTLTLGAGASGTSPAPIRSSQMVIINGQFTRVTTRNCLGC